MKESSPMNDSMLPQ